MEEVSANSCRGILPLISTLRHRWTISGFFLRLSLGVFLALFGAHIVAQMSVPPKKLASPVPINTDPTDRYCRQWLKQYPVGLYDGCQKFHGVSSGR